MNAKKFKGYLRELNMLENETNELNKILKKI